MKQTTVNWLLSRRWIPRRVKDSIAWRHKEFGTPIDAGEYLALVSSQIHLAYSRGMSEAKKSDVALGGRTRRLFAAREAESKREYHGAD